MACTCIGQPGYRSAVSDVQQPIKSNVAPGAGFRSSAIDLSRAVVGNLTYRLSALILLALYAARLGPAQFGWLEQLLAISLFLVPLASMQIHEAFLSLYQKNRSAGASTAAALLIPVSAVLLLAGSGVAAFAGGLWTVAAVLAAHAVSTILWQYVRNLLRASSRYDVAMKSDVLLAVISLAVGAALLFWMDFGVDGALLGVAAGNAAASGFAVWRSLRAEGLVSFSEVSRGSVLEVLSISKRLVPNVILWWAIELSDRLLIAYFEGDRAVGLYSAGARVAGILMAGMLLLYQVWQIPAIRAIREGTGGAFLEKSFRLFFLGVVVSASALLSMAVPITTQLLGVQYAESIGYVTILVPALSLAALCYFFGIWYYSAESRHSALTASSAGLFVSLTMNVALIPIYGAVAAAASTLAAYAVMCAMRYREAKGHLGLRIDWRVVWFPSFVLGLQAIGLYFEYGVGWLWLGTLMLIVGFRRDIQTLFVSLRQEGASGDENDGREKW